MVRRKRQIVGAPWRGLSYNVNEKNAGCQALHQILTFTGAPGIFSTKGRLIPPFGCDLFGAVLSAIQQKGLSAGRAFENVFELIDTIDDGVPGGAGIGLKIVSLGGTQH